MSAVADSQSGGATYPSLVGACDGTNFSAGYDSEQAALDAVSVDCPIGRSYFCSGRTGSGLHLYYTRPSWESSYVNSEAALIGCLVSFFAMVGVMIGFIVALRRTRKASAAAAPIEMVG